MEGGEPSPAIVANKYRIDRELGRGAVGAVFAATHLVTRAPVALKILHPALSDDTDAVQRFLREARAAARVAHENVAEVRDAGEDGERLYIAMRLVDGTSLRAHLDAEGALPVPEAVHIAACVAEGAAAAHRAGVVHRDLKPENIVLERASPSSPLVPRIVDFGVSKLLGPADVPRLTASGVALGTPRYAAPEQLGDAKHVDERADVYAIGAVLFEMLTGSPPHAGARSLTDLIVRMRTHRIPRVAGLREDVPPELDAVVAGALEIDRERRWGSAGALAAALRASVGLEPEAELRVAGIRPALGARVAALCALALAVAALAAGSTWGEEAVAAPASVGAEVREANPGDPVLWATERPRLAPVERVAGDGALPPRGRDLDEVRRARPAPARRVAARGTPPSRAAPAPPRELEHPSPRTRRLSSDEF